MLSESAIEALEQDHRSDWRYLKVLQAVSLLTAAAIFLIIGVTTDRWDVGLIVGFAVWVMLFILLLALWVVMDNQHKILRNQEEILELLRDKSKNWA